MTRVLFLILLFGVLFLIYWFRDKILSASSELNNIDLDIMKIEDISSTDVKNNVKKADVLCKLKFSSDLIKKNNKYDPIDEDSYDDIKNDDIKNDNESQCISFGSRDTRTPKKTQKGYTVSKYRNTSEDIEDTESDKFIEDNENDDENNNSYISIESNESNESSESILLQNKRNKKEDTERSEYTLSDLE
jgi:hypothetical protein